MDEFEEPRAGDYTFWTRWTQGWGIILTAAGGPLLVWLAAWLASAVEPWLGLAAALAVRITLILLALFAALVLVPVWTHATAFRYCAAGLWRKRMPDAASYFNRGGAEGETEGTP